MSVLSKLSKQSCYKLLEMVAVDRLMDVGWKLDSNKDISQEWIDRITIISPTQITVNLRDNMDPVLFDLESLLKKAKGFRALFYFCRIARIYGTSYNFYRVENDTSYLELFNYNVSIGEFGPILLDHNLSFKIAKLITKVNELKTMSNGKEIKMEVSEK